MKKEVFFERAIFLSWYCSKADCKFCYMSTQKDKIKNPRLARRSRESILAEVILCRALNWKIEFLSGGLESYEFLELVDLVSLINRAYGQRVWLNIGTLKKEELISLKPYIVGVCGAVECINPELREQLCPSKMICDIENMFDNCSDLGIKKSITIILGLGESENDIPRLIKFIKRHDINQITFYRLKPQKNTIFETINPISSDYYIRWIEKTRKEFNNLHIIVGSWLPNLDEIGLLLKAGADDITKFPAMKQFNTEYSLKIEKAVLDTGRILGSNLGDKKTVNMSKILTGLDIPPKIKKGVIEKLHEYLKTMH